MSVLLGAALTLAIITAACLATVEWFLWAEERARKRNLDRLLAALDGAKWDWPVSSLHPCECGTVLLSADTKLVCGDVRHICEASGFCQPVWEVL